MCSLKIEKAWLFKKALLEYSHDATTSTSG